LEAFAHFVSGQCYPLLEHGRKPGFVRQHAYNSEPVGCVHDVAAPLTAAFPGPQLLRHWPSHAEPHPEPACLAVLYAHGDPVRAVALTSEGLLGISGGGISHDEQRISDNAIRIWDLGTSRCRYVLTGHGDRVTAIAATPDGRFMLSAGADRLLCYWDLVHGQMLWQKRTSSTVDTVALTPDGRFAAWGVDYYGGEVMIWDLRQDVLVNRLSGRELGASCLAITADLSRVLTAGGSYQRVNTALRLWDGRTGDCLQSWPAHSPFTKALAVTPLGDKAISSGADGQVAVWDARRGRGLQTFQAPGATCVALTADGTIGLAGCKDGTLRCWNLENGENLGVLEAHADVVSSLAVSPDGRFALSGSHDRTVRLWDLRRFNKHSPEKQIGELSALVLSDSDNAVAGGDDGRLWFFDTPGRLPRATIERHTGAVTDLAMAADQEQIVSVGDDNTCRVWDRRSGEMLALLECESSPVSLHLSPDARHALVATQFGDLTLLDLERRVQLGHFRAEQGLMGRTFPIALLGDGKHALCTSKASVVLWEIESGSILRRFEGHESRISVFLVTPDEKTLLSGSYDGTLRVWDVSTGRCLHVLAGHTACVRCLACDEEGIVAVTGGEDAAVRVWNLRDGKLVAVHVSQYGVISSLAFNPPAVYAGTKGGVLERLDINHAAQFSATRLARTGDAIRKARGAGRWPRALVSSVLVGIQNGVWKSPDANWVRGGLVQRRFCQECGFRISETPSKAPCPECKSVWVDRVFSAVSCPSCEAMAEDWFKYCPGCGRQRY